MRRSGRIRPEALSHGQERPAPPLITAACARHHPSYGPPGSLTAFRLRRSGPRSLLSPRRFARRSRPGTGGTAWRPSTLQRPPRPRASPPPPDKAGREDAPSHAAGPAGRRPAPPRLRCPCSTRAPRTNTESCGCAVGRAGPSPAGHLRLDLGPPAQPRVYQVLPENGLKQLAADVPLLNGPASGLTMRAYDVERLAS